MDHGSPSTINHSTAQVARQSPSINNRSRSTSDVTFCYRHGFPEAAQQQRVYDRQTKRGGSGHAVPIDETHQRHLGPRRTQDSTRKRHLPGKSHAR